MQLKVDQLKEFRDRSAHIQTNNLLPVLAYLKFQPGRVTKNNMQSFLTMDVDCTETFLIDEKQLMSFVGFTKAPTIDLTVTATTVQINDGTKIRYSSPTEPVAGYPLNDEPDEAAIPVPEEMLAQIGRAAAFNVENGSSQVASHVYIGNGLLAGADGSIAYIENQAWNHDLILHRAVAATVGKLAGPVHFSENDNYHFFTAGNCKYGFVKPAIAAVNFTPFLVPVDGKPSFVVEKDYLVSLNELAITRNPLQFTLGKLKLAGNTLTVDYRSEAYGLDMTDEVMCAGDNVDWFGFNAQLLNRLLKALPGTTVRLTDMGNKLYFTTEGQTYLALMGRIDV